VVNVFRVHEGLEPFMPAFIAVPAILDSAEWGLNVSDSKTVDANAARLQLFADGDRRC
jgi:hypothetical protein